MSIVEEIVEKRRARTARQGPATGLRLPPRRSLPLTRFGVSQHERDFFIIGEIKRGSPSRGLFAAGTDAVAQAEQYVSQGVKTVSVLTEEEYFHGSLKDLIEVKQRFPNLCVMRKDFILDEEDIDVSHRAGADAILLIASMHDTATLHRLYHRAKELGLEVLLETHDLHDLRKAASVKPAVTGINCRNLSDFSIDPGRPLELRRFIDWSTDTVFESGIATVEHAAVALSGGFSGMLIGEAAMKDPVLLSRIARLARSGLGDFWYRLFSSKTPCKPLVKICGITRERDARLAAELGAQVLGFIFAPSPRRADPSLLEKISDLDQLKVAVVVGDKDDRSIDSRIQDLMARGGIDAVQFHGEESPHRCYSMAFPYYKALRIGHARDVDLLEAYFCPRVLVDARVPGKAGGTGRLIPAELVGAVRKRHRLWLAGGIGPDNVAGILHAHKPELIDVSSMLESEPGIKSERRMRALFREIESQGPGQDC
jgi:indole-3-glycerol phosphate synthase/phosphoribosylanthranilate isomerase